MEKVVAQIDFVLHDGLRLSFRMILRPLLFHGELLYALLGPGVVCDRFSVPGHL